MSKQKTADFDRKITAFKQKLSDAGIKVTHQRLVVFEEISQDKSHPDVEAVFKKVRRRIPTISLDTVYRTLKTFLDLGLITSVGVPSERVRYDGNPVTHLHYVCSKCRRVWDLFGQEQNDYRIKQEVAQFGSVESIHLEVLGVCHQCTDSNLESE